MVTVMLNRFVRFGVCLVLPAFGVMFCQPAWGQIPSPPFASATGIFVVHSEYNDLVMQVNHTAGEVFASLEGRKAGASEVLKAIDRLIPMVEENLYQHKWGADSHYVQQLQLYYLIRLALEEPNAVQANQAAMARGGQSAALASLERAAAAWLNAGQDSKAQSAAFDSFRAAIKASGQSVPLDLWSDLLRFNPPASDTVGTPLLAYLEPYCNDIPSVAMLNHFKILVKQMELEGKPLTIDGTLVSGAHFSTSAWKGRVILIVGWATGFPKDIPELQRVQSILARHRAQGLEVLGIAYGETPGGVKAILASHPELTFPELYDASHPDIAEVCSGTTTFGLAGEAMGAVRVIDRKGVHHYTYDPFHPDGYDPEKAEAEVVRLLAEAP
jgi:hypothetical protein